MLGYLSLGIVCSSKLSFSQASLSENCSLLGTVYVCEQISEHIFAPIGGLLFICGLKWVYGLGKTYFIDKDWKSDGWPTGTKYSFQIDFGSDFTYSVFLKSPRVSTVDDIDKRKDLRQILFDDLIHNIRLANSRTVNNNYAFLKYRTKPLV